MGTGSWPRCRPSGRPVRLKGRNYLEATHRHTRVHRRDDDSRRCRHGSTRRPTGSSRRRWADLRRRCERRSPERCCMAREPRQRWSSLTAPRRTSAVSGEGPTCGPLTLSRQHQDPSATAAKPPCCGNPAGLRPGTRRRRERDAPLWWWPLGVGRGARSCGADRSLPTRIRSPDVIQCTHRVPCRGSSPGCRRLGG